MIQFLGNNANEKCPKHIVSYHEQSQILNAREGLLVAVLLHNISFGIDQPFFPRLLLIPKSKLR